MTIGFEHFESLHTTRALDVDGAIQFADVSQKDLKVAQFHGRTVRPPDHDEQVQNAKVVKAFANAIAQKYEPIYALKVLSQVNLRGEKPLETRIVREALDQGVEHLKLKRGTEFYQKVCDALMPGDMPSQSSESLPLLDQLIGEYGKEKVQPEDRTKLRDEILSKLSRLPKGTPISTQTIKQLATQTVQNFYDPKPLSIELQLSAQKLTRDPRMIEQQQASPLKSENLEHLLVGLKYEPASLSSSKSVPTTPTEYFGQVTVQGRDVLREWNVNFAVLSELASRLPHDNPLRVVLMERALGYLNKFASVPNLDTMKWQGNPVIAVGREDYHRNGTNMWSQGYRRDIAEHLGISTAMAYPISSIKVMDVIQRQFGLKTGTDAVMQLTAENIPHVLKKIAKMAVEGEGDFFIDISQQIHQSSKPLAEATNDACAMIRDAIEKEVRQTWQQNQMSGDPAAVVNFIAERVMLGAMVQVRDQPVIVARGLDKARDLFSLGSVLSDNGFTVGPAQMMENWASITPELKNIIDAIEKSMPSILAESVQFPAHQVELPTFNGLKDFLQNSTTLQFADLVNSRNSSAEARPYVTVLASVTMKVLDGLASSANENKFASKEANAAFQYCCNRMLAAMDASVKNQGQMGAFLNSLNLVHEEIATLLAIAQPYDLNDFNAIMAKVTKAVPENFPVTPRFEFKNSGMNCFGCVLSGIESLTGKRNFNAAFLEGTYYEESDYVLKRAGYAKKHTISGEDVPQSIESIRQNLKSSQKLDLFVGEFHHNISTSKNAYAKEAVIEHVRALLKSGLCSDKFTVALDTTIATTDAPELKEFLETFKTEIDEGTLNVIFFRSGQKFDLAGLDHYNGGIMATFNKQEAFADYNTGAQDLSAPVSKANAQGIILFQQFAQEELNQYRRAIMDAHASFFRPYDTQNNPSGLPPQLLTTSLGEKNPVLQVATNTDTDAVFLDLRSPAFQKGETNPMYESIAQCIEGLAAELNLPLSGRPSFGFAHANLTSIGGLKLRLTMGLEDSKALTQYRNILVTVADLGATIHRCYPGNAKIATKVLTAGAPLTTSYHQLATRGQTIAELPFIEQLQLANAWQQRNYYSPAAEILLNTKPQPGNESALRNKTMLDLLRAMHDNNAESLPIAHDLLVALRKANSLPKGEQLTMQLKLADRWLRETPPDSNTSFNLLTDSLALSPNSTQRDTIAVGYREIISKVLATQGGDIAEQLINMMLTQKDVALILKRDPLALTKTMLDVASAPSALNPTDLINQAVEHLSSLSRQDATSMGEWLRAITARASTDSTAAAALLDRAVSKKAFAKDLPILQQTRLTLLDALLTNGDLVTARTQIQQIVKIPMSEIQKQEFTQLVTHYALQLGTMDKADALGFVKGISSHINNAPGLTMKIQGL